MSVFLLLNVDLEIPIYTFLSLINVELDSTSCVIKSQLCGYAYMQH